MVFNGILVVDKPEGMPSLEIVKELKRRFNIKKAGHIGTLDPFATGVLPVAINEGTKLIPFIKEEPKDYEGIMKLGEETNTGDRTGNVTSKKTLGDITKEDITRVFNYFKGRVKQIPPMFSAVKVDGRPLYKLARKGLEIDRPEREIEVFDLKVLQIDLPLVKFYISCSKGTYIRVLASDIGRRLGSGAHLIGLRRVRSGFFDLSKAVSWERLIHIVKYEDLSSHLISLNESLPHLFEAIGDDETIRKVKNGQWLMENDISKLNIPEIEVGSFIRLCSKEKELIAILRSEIKRIEDNGLQLVLRPARIFNSTSNPYVQLNIHSKSDWNERITLS